MSEINEWKNDPHTLTLLERVQMKFNEAGSELADNPAVLQKDDRFMYAGVRVAMSEVIAWINELSGTELAAPGEGSHMKHSMSVTPHTPQDFEQLLESLDV